MSENYPIDFVVTWVDGNDPVWQAEKAKYAGHECDGCWKRTCAKNIDCLASIKPNQVIEKLRQSELLKDE